MKRGILILGLLVALVILLANPVSALRENIYITRLRFENEYTLAGDFLPLLILLVARSVGYVHRWWMRIAITYAVLLNCVALFVLPVVLPWAIGMIKRLL